MKCHKSSGGRGSGCVWILLGRLWCTCRVGHFGPHTAELCPKKECKEGSLCQDVVMSIIPGSVFSLCAREGRLGRERRAGVHQAHPLPAHALLERREWQQVQEGLLLQIPG